MSGSEVLNKLKTHLGAKLDKDLAAALGISSATLGNWRRRSPKIDTIFRNRPDLLAVLAKPANPHDKQNDNGDNQNKQHDNIVERYWKTEGAFQYAKEVNDKFFARIEKILLLCETELTKRAAERK